MKIHIQNLFYFAPLEMRSVSKPGRTFQPPRVNPAKCTRCPEGYYEPVRRDGVSVMECSQCGAARGVDQPGDMDLQGRAFTGGQA